MITKLVPLTLTNETLDPRDEIALQGFFQGMEMSAEQDFLFRRERYEV
jgi:hypothetical protein